SSHHAPAGPLRLGICLPRCRRPGDPGAAAVTYHNRSGRRPGTLAAPATRRGASGMPVAFVFESEQVDQSGYDALMKAIGRESIDAPNPPGHIAHLAGPRAG